MNIISELKVIALELGRFPKYCEISEMPLGQKLLIEINASGKRLYDYAQELGYDTAKCRNYWTEDTLLEAYSEIINQYDGWPDVEVLHKYYGNILIATYRLGQSPLDYRNKLGVVHLSKHKKNQCKNCCNYYTPSIGKNTSRQKFCTDECKINYFRVKQNERAALRVKQPKECPICNQVFVPRFTTKQKYCERRCFTSFRKKMDKAIRRCMETLGTEKQATSQKLLGYTAEDLLNHLKEHPNWKLVQNTDWQLDHIFPVKAFIDRGIKDIALINCLNNLQPLSVEDNLKKGGNYDPVLFESWLNNHK